MFYLYSSVGKGSCYRLDERVPVPSRFRNFPSLRPDHFYCPSGLATLQLDLSHPFASDAEVKNERPFAFSRYILMALTKGTALLLP